MCVKQTNYGDSSKKKWRTPFYGVSCVKIDALFVHSINAFNRFSVLSLWRSKQQRCYVFEKYSRIAGHIDILTDVSQHIRSSNQNFNYSFLFCMHISIVTKRSLQGNIKLVSFLHLQRENFKLMLNDLVHKTWKHTAILMPTKTITTTAPKAD